MCSDGPPVAKRINQRAGSVAVELVFHRPFNCRAGINCLTEHRIDALHVEQQTDRRAAERLRADNISLGKFVRQHDGRIADSDFGVHDFPVGDWHAKQLGGSKGAFVKVDGFRGSTDDQIRRRRVITVRNGFCFRSHGDCLTQNSVQVET